MYVIPTPTRVSLSGEPISLDEAKLFLSQDFVEDDSLVTALIAAARQYFEVACDRQFCSATWTVKLPGFYPGAWANGWPVAGWNWYGPGYGTWSRLNLPYPPLISVSSVQYLAQTTNVLTTLPTTVYNVVTTRTPGVVELGWDQVWPVAAIHPEAVTITFTAGYGDATAVPELVKQGIKLLIAHWFDHRGDTADIPPAVSRIAWAAAAHRF